MGKNKPSKKLYIDMPQLQEKYRWVHPDPKKTFDKVEPEEFITVKSGTALEVFEKSIGDILIGIVLFIPLILLISFLWCSNDNPSEALEPNIEKYTDEFTR